MAISLLDDKLLEGRGQIQSPLSPWEGPAHRGDPTNVCWPTRDRNRTNSESLGYLPASRRVTATASNCSDDLRGHIPPGHQSSKNPDIEISTSLYSTHDLISKILNLLLRHHHDIFTRSLSIENKH